MTADERAKAVADAEVRLAEHGLWHESDCTCKQDQAVLALDAQLTAVEKERDEAWGTAALGGSLVTSPERQAIETIRETLRYVSDVYGITKRANVGLAALDLLANQLDRAGRLETDVNEEETRI